ncbi:hypothetical protein MCUN1_002298 [Malassezia cuniculi]|uniref:Uncharacterized protein n=1 Tax=Malassezia cuniculi TaxID=948313 RepID=A0AAF0J786_9BASI|nr:hypothetical protein MCUN1_002298 [Malassezia cuniculi]
MDPRRDTRARLHALFGRRRDEPAQKAIDATIEQLDAAGDALDDSIAEIRDALGSRVAELRVPLTDAQLDAEVLALLLAHRDDIAAEHAASAKAPQQAGPNNARFGRIATITPRAAGTESVGQTKTPWQAAPPAPAATAPSFTPGARSFTPGVPAFAPDTHLSTPAVPAAPAHLSPQLDDDEDEDEFSPFAKAAPTISAPAPVIAPTFGPMSPFDVFCNVLREQHPGLFSGTAGKPPRLTPQILHDALERSNYDLEATLATLRGARPTDAPAERPSWKAPSGVSVVPREVFARAGAGGSSSHESTTRVCRFFLAGECRRADCRFSHDVGKSLCRFWLRGTCLNDPCSFLHDFGALTMLVSQTTLDDTPAAAAGAARAPASAPASAPAPAPASAPAPSTTAPRVRATTSNRWAAAVQRPKAANAVQRVAGGAAAVPLSAVKAPARQAAPAPPAAAKSVATAPPPARPKTVLRPPTLLPTLSTGTALSAEFTKLRAQGADADRLVRERHRRIRETLLIGAGGDAGGWGSSAQASDERGAHGQRGRWVGGGIGLCLGVARQENVARVSRGVRDLSLEERTEVFLDLHGLQSEEALAVTERFLLALEGERFRGIAVLGVGAAKHSGRRGGRIAADVRAFLAEWGYPYAEYDGVVVCDPCTHL